MTPRLRYGSIIAVVVMAAIAAFLFIRSDHPALGELFPLAVNGKTEKTEPINHEKMGEGNSRHAHKPHAGSAAESLNTTLIPLERLQTIGVTFEPAVRQPVDHTIRTVGRVEVDERLLSRVTIKLEGWVDQLFVNFTGEHVKKGQKLFALYSPELVATQEEYLIALSSSRTLGKSEFPEVATGARALLESSRRRLLLWDIEPWHIRDLEQTGEVLLTLPIHAPQTGTVINKTAVVGLYTKPGDELYTIADLSRIWIIGDIYEYEMPLVEIGQIATVTLSYVPDVKLQARLTFIYPTIDPQTRTGKVRFELDNPGERLKPGMYANLELKVPLGVRLVVPRNAVLESGERQIIFIHQGGGRLEWREVKIGQRSGDWVEILDGIQQGEHVVTSANFLIDSESQLKAAIGAMPGMKH
ncbi:efflux RND transporter periplasmic adaptor subunit [Nitrosomonas communis]|uniref:Membrane fusion protein, Cu(I)/Ag(I) efflux system n=1 Tax=Nitrosomonas communis TaxID=44574 RepID=A0A1I4TY84_9PROT|nr:efflux RND transporter periplasmic adaptor subunit [Nitrosomonas communis]SFM81587.1 membrane fusion protein, Cu(I)/Ag(I) efflux system [Nitrosomonas communis]